MTLFDDNTRLCSGTLLNDDCSDYTPYFLTALHCADNAPGSADPCNDGDFHDGVLSTAETDEVENWVFRFQYKSPTCNGSEPGPGLFYTFQGSTVRAINPNSDAILVEMDQRPSATINSEIKYVGWDRRANEPSNGAVIGHPAGDVMKISPYNSAPTNNTPIQYTGWRNSKRQYQ